MARRFVVFLVAFLVIGVPVVTRASARAAQCTDPSSAPQVLRRSVGGGTATGYFALPRRTPGGLVVFSHGYGPAAAAWRGHLSRVARQLDVITVAVDGRDLRFVGSPRANGERASRGWPVTSAAQDGIAAAQLLLARCPSATTVVNYGVSMGGNTSGLMAAAGAKRPDRSPLFDYWFDIEGVTNVISTYTGARAIAPVNDTGRKATEDIERETGGPIEKVPRAFAQRAVITRAGDIAASGVKGVVFVHGVDDGTVGFEQSQYMRAALVAEGVNTQFFAVTRKSGGSERDSTETGYVGDQLDPKYRSPLAGHGDERSNTHIVIVTGFSRLTALFRGVLPQCRSEHLVDGGTGAIVPEPGPC